MKKKGKEKRFVSDLEWMRRVALGALAILLALHGGWVAWFNVSRAPQNIFDELANCAVDYASGDPLSSYSRRSFGLAWSNPFRSYDIDKVKGVKCMYRNYISFVTERNPYDYPNLEEEYRRGELGEFLSNFFFTNHSHDASFSVDGRAARLKSMGFCVLDGGGQAEVGVTYVYVGGDPTPRTLLMAVYDRGSHSFTQVLNQSEDRAASVQERQAMEAAIATGFLPAYFEAAGPSSAFSMDDLGEWGYEEG